MTGEPAPLRPGADGWCHGLATVVRSTGRRLLLLPFAAPVGASRGRQYLVALGDAGRARRRVVFSMTGRAALVAPDDLAESTVEVPVRLRPLPDRRGRRVPGDLAEALDAEGLNLDAVPDPERNQLILMVNESATRQVRADRLAAAVQVVRIWSRRAR